MEGNPKAVLPSAALAALLLVDVSGPLPTGRDGNICSPDVAGRFAKTVSLTSLAVSFVWAVGAASAFSRRPSGGMMRDVDGAC